MKHLLFLFIVCCCHTCFATDTTALNNYRDRVVQVFNQCSLVYSQVNDAIKTKNPEDIERWRVQLLGCANDGMKQLDSIPDYESDPALKYSCRDVLKFYKQLAQSDLPQVRDFFTVEANFLAIKKEFEKKKIKKHSEQEIIAYNSEANKYNEAITRYTQLNTFIESSRKLTLYNWNASAKIFMNEHK